MNTIYAILTLLLFGAATLLMVVDSIQTRRQLRENRETDVAILETLRKQRVESAFRGAVAAPKEEWRQLFPKLFREEE